MTKFKNGAASSLKGTKLQPLNFRADDTLSGALHFGSQPDTLLTNGSDFQHQQAPAANLSRVFRTQT
jgi:hypothetical protein